MLLQALRYLEDRPAAKMTADQIKLAETRYKTLPFPLKSCYITQLINNPPQSVVDIQVVSTLYDENVNQFIAFDALQILGENIHDKTEENLQAILDISKETFTLLS